MGALTTADSFARRDHGFPAATTKPSLTVTARSLDPALGEANAARGVKVITLPDERWARPDIKTLQLLPNVLAKRPRAADAPTDAIEVLLKLVHRSSP